MYLDARFERFQLYNTDIEILEHIISKAKFEGKEVISFVPFFVIHNAFKKNYKKTSSATHAVNMFLKRIRYLVLRDSYKGFEIRENAIRATVINYDKEALMIVFGRRTFELLVKQLVTERESFDCISVMFEDYENEDKEVELFITEDTKGSKVLENEDIEKDSELIDAIEKLEEKFINESKTEQVIVKEFKADQALIQEG